MVDTSSNFSVLTSKGILRSRTTVFMKAVVRERRIPFEIRTEQLDEVSAKGRLAFYALRAEARRNGLTDMTLEEINEEIRAARRGE